MQTVVDIEGLSHFYGPFQALRELSLSVPKGCFFIVIGPNGSGKTTLVNAMAGLLPVSGGKTFSAIQAWNSKLLFSMKLRPRLEIGPRAL